MLKACVAQILLEKSYNVEKFLRAIGARRGVHGAIFLPPFATCSLLSLIFAKPLLLEIRSENIFELSIVTALTAYYFSKKVS